MGYELHGELGSEEYKGIMSAGTDRIAALRCDMATPKEFVARADALAVKPGYMIETMSLVHSLHPHELEADSLEDRQHANDLAYEFAKRLHPNSDVLAITHADSAGRNLHTRIKVMNHGNVTGRAIRGNDMHWQFQQVNVYLLRERGMWVTNVSKQRTWFSYWDKARNSENAAAFDLQLGDKSAESLATFARSMRTATSRCWLRKASPSRMMRRRSRLAAMVRILSVSRWAGRSPRSTVKARRSGGDDVKRRRSAMNLRARMHRKLPRSTGRTIARFEIMSAKE